MNGARKFLSVVIASGLDFDILTPEDVIRHVTMEVLANHLPSDMVADLLEAGLSAEAMTAPLVLDTLGVEGIAEHVPMPVLWACVAESAGRSLSDKGASGRASGASTKSKAKAKTPAKSKAKDKVKAAPSTSPTAAPEPETAAPLDLPVVPEAAPAMAVANTIARQSSSALADKGPSPLPTAELAPVTEVESVPVQAEVIESALKPNRSADAPEPAEVMATVTTTGPALMDVEEASGERMETYSDEDDAEISYHDMDTSIGTMEPEVAEIEYGDENLTYSNGDEVTTFGGQDN